MTIIKSVSYRKAKVYFSLDEKYIAKCVDGNEIFDVVDVSKNIGPVIRANCGSIWCKIYDAPDAPLAHLYATNELYTIVKKALASYTNTKEFFSSQTFFREEDFDLGSNYDMVFIVFPNYLNPKKYTTVILDFEEKRASFEYIWENGKDASENQLKYIINNLAKYMQLDKIRPEVKIKDITADIYVSTEKIELEILSDVITNDPLLRKRFRLCEKYFPMSLKSKYSIKLHNLKLHPFDEEISLFFIKQKNYIIRAVKIGNEDLLPLLVKEIIFLLNKYEEKKHETKSVYEHFFKHKIYTEESLSKDSLGNIKTLRNEVPELFVSGYSRECSTKPFIVNEADVIKLNEQGRKSMKYPIDGPYSRIYACPVGYYPGLKLNKLKNKTEFEYLPVCYITDHSVNKNSNYSFYFENRQKKKTMQTKRLRTILEVEEIGSLPSDLAMLLDLKTRNNDISLDISSMQKFFRRGSPRSKSSVLYCIISSLGSSIYLDELSFIRTQLQFNPEICKQEMWNVTTDEILERARDADVFLDPSLFIMALESIFGINLYIFDVDEKFKSKLSIPKCPSPYIWEPREGPSIIILCYRDVQEYPHCEFVVLDNLSSTIFEEYKKDFLTVLEGSKPIKPPLEDTINYSAQKINREGKCISVRRENIWIECFWRPLDLPIEKNNANSDEISMCNQNMEKAYFMWSVANIIARFDLSSFTKYFEVSSENIDFEPFVIRERFSNVNECISFYTNRLPLLFNKSKMIILPKMFKYLIDSVDYYQKINNKLLFVKVISQKHFIQRKLNKVIIVKR